MPQPIDPHTELARITTMERVQQIADRQSLAAHQRIADQALQQQVNAQTQAQQTEQKGEEIDRDARGQAPGREGKASSGGEDRGEKPKPSKGPPVPPPETHTLDISI